MLLQIEHSTEYRYDDAPTYGVMRLRVFPRSLGPQRVLDWQIGLEGAERQIGYRDHLGNEVWLISALAGAEVVRVTARGRVETRDTHGVFGVHRSMAPLWLFTRPTPLTQPGSRIAALAGQVSAPRGGGDDALGTAHRIMNAVADSVVYELAGTHPSSTAEDAMARGTGVCQDHAHVMVSVARAIGLPARYVSGYLRMDARDDQTATHAWAELHLPGLGWVGFDASNRICPDDRYVRLASGRDYTDAAPVGGVRFGTADERMHVALHVAEQ